MLIHSAMPRYYVGSKQSTRQWHSTSTNTSQTAPIRAASRSRCRTPFRARGWKASLPEHPSSARSAGDASRLFLAVNHTKTIDVKRVVAFPGGLYGIRSIRLHDLRHTNSTWLKDLDVPERDIQAMLGHANGAMTRHYEHGNWHTSRQATAQVAELLQGR